MERVTVSVSGLEGLLRFVGGVVRFVARLAFVDLLAVAAIASVLARGEFTLADGVITAILLVVPAILLLFAAGLREVMRLPERLRRMPQQGSEQLAELTRIAGEARRAGFRRAPSLLWRLRGIVGSTRDLVGVAVPLRVFTPPFLGLTFGAVGFSFLLVFAGLIALVVLAFG
jgi:hypothetical protein